MTSTSPSGNTATATTVDTTPLLSPSVSDQIHRSRSFISRPPSLRRAARFLRRAGSRRMMREPSMRVRESAAEQIEERQSDWAYSRPIVILDLVWNFVFIACSIGVLFSSWNELPLVPLRLWIAVYCLQCVLHMVCVFVEYRNKCRQRFEHETSEHTSSSSSSASEVVEGGDSASSRQPNDDYTSVTKHLESANTMFSFIWWIMGYRWLSAGGQDLTVDSPQLYWLCITFLAFDIFFVVMCATVACVISIAVCCCLPCILAILHAVADQEGATKDDIERLPKYKFRRIDDFEKQNGEIQEAFGGIMKECSTDSPIEHVLRQEDAECCICLCAYDDGTELRELPCCHHFHCACIDKWLSINATCPLCKFNILNNGSSQSSSEEA